MQQPKLKLTEWTNTMSVGIDMLDRDHQKIFGLIREMYTLMEAGTGQATGVVEAAIREVIDYTDYHFRREELLMEVCDYPYLENHRQVHEMMKERTAGFLKVYQHDRTAFLPEKFIRFMEDWWTDHIMGMDKGYQSWMEGKAEDIEHALADRS